MPHNNPATRKHLINFISDFPEQHKIKSFMHIKKSRITVIYTVIRIYKITKSIKNKRIFCLRSSKIFRSFGLISDKSICIVDQVLKMIVIERLAKERLAG